MSNRCFFGFTCALILSIPGLTSAAQSPETVEADFFEDAPLILTASRMSKPLAESPASVSIIDRQMIEASGAREIADLFRLVPGFIVGRFNGDKPVVTYQGLGEEFPRKMQVLIDGRSVFVPSFGGVPWSNLPLLLEDIERIEVIRGPNAVTYGANAFLATINIITRHAAEDYGARYSITASDNANPDIKDAYLRLGFHFEDLDWRLSVGTSSDDGFVDVSDSRDINKLNFRLDYLSGSNQSWTFQLGGSDSTHGRGFAGNPLNFEREADATNIYLNILWERNVGRSVSSIRLTYTEQQVVDRFDSDPAGGVIVNIDFGRTSKRTDLELVQSQEVGDSLRVVYGGSLRNDRVKSLFLLNDREFHDVDTGRIFAALEWRLDQNWLFDFGTTLEDSNLTERESSPRLSIIRKLNPGHALRFVASRAKRNPILYEYDGLTIFDTNLGVIQLWQGNPDIEPEDIISYEIGIRSEFTDRGISSDVKLFTYKISDHIVNVPTGNPNVLGDPIETTANQGETRVSGLELALDFSPTPKLDIKSGFSFVGSDSTDQRFDNSIPDKTAFINADYRWQARHKFSASYYYVDRMQWLDGDIIEPIRKLDLRYAYIIDQRSETRIELIGQNLLEDYNDYFSENLVEKIFLLRISGSF
ncbi:MAG: TonB-dependent receptor plug domain-containing protein [Gammaproteobacteria bacterium]